MNISISNLIDNATTPGKVDPLTAALIGEWPLADNGTKSKGPVDAELHTGAAFDFTAGTYFLDSFTTVSITGVYTWAASVKIPVAAGGGPGLEGSIGADKYGLLIKNVGTPEFKMYTGSGSNTINHTVSVGTWYRVVGVYDGTTFRLYVNGIEVGTDTTGTGGLEVSSIGGASGSTNECYMGKVEVYSAAWDVNDVTYDLNNSSVGLFAFDRPGTSLTYADAELIYLGVSVSNTIRDFSSNVNNGNLTVGYNAAFAPQDSYCIQLANYRDGFALVGAGRSSYVAYPDPDDPTQGLTGVAITRPKKTAVTADEGMNFSATSGGGGYGSVNIPQDAAFDPDGANGFSVSYWIYYTTAEPSPIGGRHIFQGDDNSSVNLAVLISDSSGTLAYELKGALASAKDTSAGTLAAGWNHICVTYDGTSAIALYVNGASSSTVTSTLGTLTNYPIIIGNDSTSSGFEGCGRMINWVGWYNMELTAAQVSTVYNARLSVHP
jgi:hypothetical protein